MTSRGRWLVRLAIGAAIAAVSSLITLLAVALQPTPTVPLTDNLPGKEISNESRMFDQRIRKRFPIGSLEAHMAEELSSEGFIRGDWSYAKRAKSEAWAIRVENNVACAQHYGIYWQADEAGRLTSIRGDYYPTCL